MDSSAYQLATVAHPVNISLDKAAILFSLCAESCNRNSSTGFNVLSPESARLLSCWPLLRGHFPPHSYQTPQMLLCSSLGCKKMWSKLSGSKYNALWRPSYHLFCKDKQLEHYQTWSDLNLDSQTATQGVCQVTGRQQAVSVKQDSRSPLMGTKSAWFTAPARMKAVESEESTGLACM